MTKLKTGRKDRWGQRRINRKKIKKEEQEQGEEDSRGPPHSHTVSHGVRVKVRYKQQKEKLQKQKVDGMT